MVLAGYRIPDGMIVMHKCDNPSCVRVSHLKIGTIEENVADKISKGRHWGNHRLCELDVWLIRNCELSVNKLADFFGLTARAIRDVLNRRTWRHVQ